jgi:hypothetical protein
MATLTGNGVVRVVSPPQTLNGNGGNSVMIVSMPVGAGRWETAEMLVCRFMKAQFGLYC